MFLRALDFASNNAKEGSVMSIGGDSGAAAAAVPDSQCKGFASPGKSYENASGEKVMDRGERRLLCRAGGLASPHGTLRSNGRCPCRCCAARA